MTTILGVQTGKDVEPEGIVLVSDTQLTDYEGDKLTQKRYGLKLISGTCWMIGYAGNESEELNEFFGFLRGKKKVSADDVAKEIKKSIEVGYFERVNQLNRSMWPEAEGEIDELNTFVLAVNEPALALYRIDEFGNVIPPSKEKKISYICEAVSTRVDDYIEDLISSGKIELDNFSMDNVIMLIFDAMTKVADRDIYTGGPLDMAVMTKGKIDKYGKMISDNRIRADKASMEHIISKYVPKEPEQPKQG